MKKAWQIWLIYSLCILVILPAIIWLSVINIRLEIASEKDRVQTELARQEAELQERVSSALWRMDGFLTNLIARESTRPWYWYRTFYGADVLQTGMVVNPSLPKGQTMGSKDPLARSDQWIASPLLYKNSPYVKLYFEIDAQGNVTSPQSPEGEVREMAMLQGFDPKIAQSSAARLSELKAKTDYSSMLLKCSEQSIANNSTSPNLDPSLATQTGEVAQDLESDRPLNLDAQQSQRDPSNSPIQQRGWANNPDPSQKLSVQQRRSQSRGVQEFSQRRLYADNALTEWQSNFTPDSGEPDSRLNVQGVMEGVMQPIWMGSDLFFLRKIENRGQISLQGCWIDWTPLRDQLVQMVSDLLPKFDLEPITNLSQVASGQSLAVLPIQLKIDRDRLAETLNMPSSDAIPLAETSRWSSVFLSGGLWVAWLGFAFSAVMGAFLIRGLIQLSERRGAFVSAVTHELRTPLTTFRMYAEMLAEKMVPPERQEQYVRTLKVEAERLSHLVENVLQFARLEKSPGQNRREETTLGALVERFLDRLEARAAQANMSLVLNVSDSLREMSLYTEPAVIEQILFNLVDNACKYAKQAEDRRIILLVHTLSQDLIEWRVRDFGPGIPAQEQKRLFRPFHKSDIDAANSEQGVGLGLALCRRMAKSIRGQLEIVQPPAGETGALLVLRVPKRS